jgi:hypothetical protein
MNTEFNEMITKNWGRRATTRARLQGEALEQRQLLHGGGIVQAMPVEDLAVAIMDRYDADDSGEIVAEEVTSEPLWERLSGVDADENGGVSLDELIAGLDAGPVGGGGPREGGHHGRGHHGGSPRGETGHDGRGLGLGSGASLAERVDAIFENAGDDDLLNEDEVSACVWNHIGEADTDGDTLISRDELTVKLEVDVAERVAAIVDRVFSKDVEADGLTADEVSGRLWARVSVADGFLGDDADGVVTQDELSGYLTDRLINGTSSDDDSDSGTDDSDTTDGTDESEGNAVVAAQVARASQVASFRAARAGESSQASASHSAARRR